MDDAEVYAAGSHFIEHTENRFESACPPDVHVFEVGGCYPDLVLGVDDLFLDDGVV